MARPRLLRLAATVGLMNGLMGLIALALAHAEPDVTSLSATAPGARVQTGRDLPSHPAPARPRKLAGSPRPTRNPLKLLPKSRHDSARTAAQLRSILRAASANQAEPLRPYMLDPWQIWVVDGDSFEYGSRRIRIRGVATPKLTEEGGLEASQRLEGLLKDGPVLIVPHKTDARGNLTADVFVNDQNVAAVLKEEGYAKPRP